MANDELDKETKKGGYANKELYKVGVQFSKENQPSKAVRRKGQYKRKLIKDIAGMAINGDPLDKALATAKQIGVEFEQITVEIAMTLKQIEKAISEGDTSAYNAAMDRLVGKPTQTVNSNVNVIEFKDLDLKFE